MTTDAWINGRVGDWSTSADRSSGAVPSPADDAVIGNSDVTVNGSAIANSPPVVNVQNFAVLENAAVAASSFITSVSNPSGDSLTYYRFEDFGIGNGHLTLNGVVEPDNQWIVVPIGNVSAVQYVGGPSPGYEQLDVWVYDASTGFWSAPSLLYATTTANDTWIPGRSGDWSASVDRVSGAVPGPAADVVIGSNLVTPLSSVTVNGSAIANSLTLNSSALSISGTLSLSTSLTVDDGSTVQLNGGTLSAPVITTESVPGPPARFLTGFGVVTGAVSGNGYVIAEGGTLKFLGSLAGDTSFFQIEPNPTLELGSGVSPKFVAFDGPGGTLKIDTPATFTGSIGGDPLLFAGISIVIGDKLDLVGITANSATMTGSTLSINETSGQILTYNNFTNLLSGISSTLQATAMVGHSSLGVQRL